MDQNPNFRELVQQELIKPFILPLALIVLAVLLGHANENDFLFLSEQPYAGMSAIVVLLLLIASGVIMTLNVIRTIKRLWLIQTGNDDRK